MRCSLRLAQLLSVLVATSAIAAPRTDVVLLRDGSRILGQVRSLDRGRLAFRTNGASTISIEWDRIVQLVSGEQLRLETSSGALYFGTLVEPASPGHLQVRGASTTTEVPLQDVVRITTMGSPAGDCWSGDASAGYSLASAHQQSQFALELNVQCRTPSLLGKLSAYDITTGTSASPSSQNAAALLEAYHLFPQRWFAGGLLEFDRNDQLGIQSRFSVGGGGGRFLLQSGSQVLGVAAGIVESREQDVDSSSPTTSTEALLQASFDWFRFASPELDLSATVTVLPSLTETGRWRGRGIVSLKWEIASDFFLRLQFLGDFDNRPGNGGTTKTDYNISTSLGYSLN